MLRAEWRLPLIVGISPLFSVKLALIKKPEGTHLKKSFLSDRLATLDVLQSSVARSLALNPTSGKTRAQCRRPGRAAGGGCGSGSAGTQVGLAPDVRSHPGKDWGAGPPDSPVNIQQQEPPAGRGAGTVAGS